MPSQVLQQRYRLIGLLGQGGMGAVYRAVDTRLNITVALKELLPQPGLNGDLLTHLRGQFVQEATVLARLNHPHLVSVTDYFEENDKAYLVMKYIEGESLAERIAREGALPEAQVRLWVAQILDALAYCHAQRVLHRDLKPQNIILQPSGDAVLVDFGLVKLWDPADPRTRTTIRGAGTPEYAPPEQYSIQSSHTDPRSDIYSLGATLYHALTGQAPPSVTDRMAFPQNFRTPRELNGRVSPGMDRMIQKAMALPQDQRWSSIAEMAMVLGTHRSAGSTTNASPVTPKRRAPALLWGLGVVVLLSLLIVGLLLRPWRENGSDLVVIATEPSSAMQETTTPGEHPTAPATRVPPPTPAPTGTPVPSPAPTMLPTSTPRPVLVYETVALGTAANAAWDHFQAPPQGEVTLDGVPFNLASRIFKSQAGPVPDNTYSTAVNINLQLPQAQIAYLLLTAGNAFTRYNGTTVGEVRVVCEGVEYSIANLILGRNLREWHSEGEVVTAAPEARQIWRGSLAGFPNLMGHIDMLTLTLPATCQQGNLTALKVLDLSTETTQSRDPALNLIGVTVAYYR
ncbi:MAG: serine/threonine protein kinase [Anaerolineae bacterium]|nr:serine/threonine protein kinase [Anaerolineae bacterium]